MGLGLKRLRHVGRYRHIMAVLIKYGFEDFVAKLHRRRAAGNGLLEYRGHTRPQRVRMALEELGPTFVKFGQLLAGRPDLLPEEYIAELSRLQDEVATGPFEPLRLELVQALGAPLEERFIEFDPVPVASGSIAQVYRAVTREGEEVAVKARRPGIAAALSAELEMIQDVAELIRSNLPAREKIDPVRLAREFAHAVRKETDLAYELRTLQRFRRNFEGDPTVYVPRDYPAYSTTGVLTMEFIHGIKPRSRQALLDADLDPNVIAERCTNFVLRQIFDFGFFHSDPHPGNFIVLKDNVVAVLDFGQVARLDRLNQELLGELVLAIVENEPDRLVHAFERQELLSDETDVRALARDMEELLDIYHSAPVKDIPFGRMMVQTFDLIRRHRVQPPSEFTLLLKSLMIIESLAKSLSPDFGLIEHLRPYARRFSLRELDPGRVLKRARTGLKDLGELLGRLPTDIGVLLRKMRRGELAMQVRHEHLDDLVRTLDKTSNRLSFALIIAGLLVGSSTLVTQKGDVLGMVHVQTLGVVGYIAAMMMGLWLLWSIIRSRHL